MPWGRPWRERFFVLLGVAAKGQGRHQTVRQTAHQTVHRAACQTAHRAAFCTAPVRGQGRRQKKLCARICPGRAMARELCAALLRGIPEIGAEQNSTTSGHFGTLTLTRSVAIIIEEKAKSCIFGNEKCALFRYSEKSGINRSSRADIPGRCVQDAGEEDGLERMIIGPENRRMLRDFYRITGLPIGIYDPGGMLIELSFCQEDGFSGLNFCERCKLCSQRWSNECVR